MRASHFRELAAVVLGVAVLGAITHGLWLRAGGKLARLSAAAIALARCGGGQI
jgi:hypothetical protein